MFFFLFFWRVSIQRAYNAVIDTKLDGWELKKENFVSNELISVKLRSQEDHFNA